MSYSATVVEVFLSSPTDVQAERDLVISYASEWNRLRSRETFCFISVLTWEGMVAPALKDRSQEVITDQIGDSYDVYLSIMWARLGTPTGAAESGTVEEFELALKRAQTGAQLRIAALFKSAPIDINTVDAGQLRKVKDFKKRLGEEGAFYREFSDESSLRSILMLLFEQIAKDAAGYSRPPLGDSPTSPMAITENANYEAEEIGLIEVGEQFARLADVLMEELVALGEEEERNNETLTACTEEIATLTRFGTLDPASAKTIFQKSADSLKGVANRYESEIDTIEDLFKEMSSLVEQDIRIRMEFDNPEEVGRENINSMKQLSATLEQSVLQLDGLIEATARLPRLSTDLAKAKSRLGKARTRLRQLLESFRQSINSSVAFFEEQDLSTI